jgi:hypothetical protein
VGERGDVRCLAQIEVAMTDVDVTSVFLGPDQQDVVPEYAERVCLHRRVGVEPQVHHQVLPPVHVRSLLVATRERKARPGGRRCAGDVGCAVATPTGGTLACVDRAKHLLSQLTQVREHRAWYSATRPRFVCEALASSPVSPQFPVF